MPYTPEQNALFRAAAQNPVLARKHGLTQKEAARMAAEGVKGAAAAKPKAAAKKAKGK